MITIVTKPNYKIYQGNSKWEKNCAGIRSWLNSQKVAAAISNTRETFGPLILLPLQQAIFYITLSMSSNENHVFWKNFGVEILTNPLDQKSLFFLNTYLCAMCIRMTHVSIYVDDFLASPSAENFFIWISINREIVY